KEPRECRSAPRDISLSKSCRFLPGRISKSLVSSKVVVGACTTRDRGLLGKDYRRKNGRKSTGKTKKPWYDKVARMRYWSMMKRRRLDGASTAREMSFPE